MAYAPDMQSAAERHYNDGSKLLEHDRIDNAGYHFGLSAECSVKQKLQACGVLSDDPAIWKHWPELRQLAFDALQGRRAQPVRTLLQHDGYMQRWSIEMRYAVNGTLNRQQVERWKEDANRALGLNL